MAKQSEGSSSSLETLQAAVTRGEAKGRPPIHLWNPPDCGDLDMRIARDGTWFHNDTPIGRPALVRLFASILRREGNRYVLVTPVEKVGLIVEDAPFLAVEMREPEPGTLELRTNVDDWVQVNAAHPLRFAAGAADGIKPYVLVRDDLWALVSRPLVYDLVERGDVQAVDGVDVFGITSAGSFFPMAPAEMVDLAS